MPFTDKDGHVTKAFQKEKHDTASQLLKRSGRHPTWSCRHSSVQWRRMVAVSQHVLRTAVHIINI